MLRDFGETGRCFPTIHRIDSRLYRRMPSRIIFRKICLTCSGSETWSVSYQRYSQLHIPRIPFTMIHGSPSITFPCSCPRLTSSTNRELYRDITEINLCCLFPESESNSCKYSPNGSLFLMM